MIFFNLILLFQIQFPSLKTGEISFLKPYFRQIPVEISSKSLNIPFGVYGAKQAFYILKEKKFKIENFREETIPNIPGKFKLFILNCNIEGKEFKIFLLMKNYKKRWLVQSFKEIP